MLEQLAIRDLVLLKRAALLPAAGLTVISGPTGGGKSLVVQALRLLRGEKGRAELVRKGAPAATVDGVFALTAGERSDMVRGLYAEILGTAPEEDRVVLTRVLDAEGRSKARVDGRPVAMRDLRRFGELLIEVHGQGQNRSLMRPDIQTELCDAYAGLSSQREEFARLLAAARELQARRDRLRSGERERRDRRAWLTHCLDEIDAVDPRAGELDELRREAAILDNLDRLEATLAGGVAELYEGADEAEGRPIVERVLRLARELGGLCAIDDRLGEGARMCEEAGLLLEEVVGELRRGLDRLDPDPERRRQVDDRLAALGRLCDRFGPDEAGLLASREEMRMELAALDDEAGGPEALDSELGRRVTELQTLGEGLTSARRKAARKLARSMTTELADLGMAKARIEVRVVARPGDLLQAATRLGSSEVEVWMAPNPGEPLTPLSETASGGEVARVMIVLKKLLADQDCVPVLVFDEADAEIGGRLGLAVGRKLRAVARSHQVLCVTHLPQIAAFAEVHFLVDKRVVEEDGDERTIAELSLLPEDERVRELAQMARGEDAVDRGALGEARKLRALAAGEPEA